MAEDLKFRRVDVGFKAGAVLSIRLQEEEYAKLTGSLHGDSRWVSLDSEDATVTLDLEDVIYVRLDTDRGRVGF